MTNRIFRSICLVALGVFLASMVLILGVVYSYYSRLQMDQLRTQAQLIAQGASHEGLEYFSNLNLEGYRVTWIHGDGTVLYDNRTESNQMENHLQRQEVADALESGWGESSRYSSTLLERSLYIARRLPDGTVVRLATTQHSVLTLVLGFAQPICIVIAVALLLSLLLAFRLSRKIVQPLNRLNLDDPLDAPCYEELTPLLRRIDAQQQQLRSQATALNRKQTEFDAVTRNMSEGLVLLNSSCVILTMNTAARQLLGLTVSSVGTDILSYHKELSGVLLSALNGDRAERLIVLRSGEYQVDASPVHSDGAVSGVVLLLFDVTEKRKAEQLRREFTANVSHELKTPLHAISGYAELMSQGIARPEDTVQFSMQIYNEAQRMIRLVEDIIRLSQLDESAGMVAFEPVELYAKAQEALNTLTVEAERAGVTLRLEGQTTTVMSAPHLVTGILRNLCDNAIKYNRPGGSVTVSVGQEDGCPWIAVADTGIGIPREHHERIFERFYRVDKSHSKAVGGTGLGLSIVKHAAHTLKADLFLESEPGIGTTITLRFPPQTEG